MQQFDQVSMQPMTQSVQLHEQQPQHNIHHMKNNSSFEDTKDNDAPIDIQDEYEDEYDTLYDDNAMYIKQIFEDAKLYESINWKLLIYWFSLWIILGMHLAAGTNTESYIALVIHFMVIIVHIIFICIALYRKRQKNKDADGAVWTFNECLNELLGMEWRDPENIYNLDQISGHFVGLEFFVVAISMHSAMIMNRIWAIRWNIGGGVLSWQRSGMILYGIGSMFFVSIGSLFSIVVAKFYVLDDEIVLKMFEYKDNKILTIKNTTIAQKLNDAIYNKTLQKWQESLYLANRKAEYCGILLFSMAFSVYGSQDDINPAVRTDNEFSAFTNFFFIFSNAIAAFSFSLLPYLLASGIRYFAYPTLVMKTFGKPIQGDTIEDYVLWWQLRRHFIENDVRLTQNVLNIVLSGTLLGSIVLLLYALQQVFTLNIGISDLLTAGASPTVKIMFVTFMLLAFVLYQGQNATFYYEQQLNHKYMLIREKLRLNAMNPKDEHQRILDFIDSIIEDIELNATAIVMLGIKVTPNIMLLLRGYVGSAVVAIALSVFNLGGD